MKKNDFIIYHPDGRVPDLQIIGITNMNEKGLADVCTVTLKGTQPQLMAMFSTIVHQLSKEIGRENVIKAVSMTFALDDAIAKLVEVVDEESEDEDE